MQKKIKISAQLKKNLIQKVWIKKEDFENFDNKIKEIKNRKDIDLSRLNIEFSEIQKKFFSEIEKNIQEKMMNFAKSWDFEHATFLRNLLFEFQNEIKSEINFLEDLKEIFWWEIKNISCFDESENFSSIINFENWIYKKEKNEIFEWKELEEIFERNLKIFEKKIENQKKFESEFFYKKLNKKDFEKIFNKIYKVESEEKKSEKRKKLEEKVKENIENNFLKKDEILDENNIKISYYWIFKKQKNQNEKDENKSNKNSSEKIKFSEKKLEDFFIWIIPIWKFDNKNYEIILENPDKNWILFWINFEELFWDFLKFLWENFSEKNFYIYWNSEIFEKKFNEFWIKIIKNLNKNSEKKLSEDFWVIPENIWKFWPSKNKNSWFIWKFSTWEKIENLEFSDLFLINSKENEKKYKNILENFSEKNKEIKKIFLTNKKFLENFSEKNPEKNKEWIKFLEKIFSESKRFLEKLETDKILKENNF